VRLDPTVKLPYLLQFGIGIERQLARATILTINYYGTRGVSLFRLRDVNAPLPPDYVARPNLLLSVSRQIESSAEMMGNSLEAGFRGNITRHFAGMAQYTLSRTYNNTGGNPAAGARSSLNSYPANNYDLSGEWARADFDQRHRFNMLGTVSAGRYFKLGIAASLYSGAPYSITTGRDDNHDGLANDRPAGVSRNSLQGPAFAGVDVRWSREDLRELEYASLLHDFGKIGVREHVLVKGKKLFPEELALIRQRFDFVIRTSEADILSRKLTAMARGASPGELLELDREQLARRAEIEEAFQTVEHANEPSVLAAGDFQRIEELGRQSFTRLDGSMATLLENPEVHSLSVMRGSLTPEEFDEIRSHVSHTYRFLSQIPWGKAFSRVAQIAGCHHERLNGTGYPNRLRAEEIPLQSKLMSISDIFDALTAADRPYKRAVPVPKALDILALEVRDEHIDGDLLRIFSEARVWEQTLAPPASERR